jgi:tripartite-type tricarboxylate transporter receptor subunit TctC
MKPNRMKTRSICAAAPLLIACAAAAAAPGAFPTKPVRLIIPWPAGGGTDIVARIIVQRVSENIGQPFVIDNRAGASGIIGTELAARAAADGYTLLMGNTATNATNASVYRKLAYDPISDFAPISLAASSPYIVSINPAVPAKSVKEFIALAKAKPGQLNFGSGGSGSAPHLAGALFNHLAGITLVHVPYKGGAAHTPALVANEVQVTLTNPPEVMPFIKTGKLRALAVTSPQRWTTMPELPTVAEAGVPGYEFTIWWGLLAPAKTSAQTVHSLYQQTRKAVLAPDVKEKLNVQGVDGVGTTPEEFAALIAREVAKWKIVARDAGIQLDY